MSVEHNKEHSNKVPKSQTLHRKKHVPHVAFMQLGVTGGAAGKQGLISQQNMICSQCRLMISPLLLLICFLTSPFLSLQPEQNPGDGWGAGECSPDVFSFI